MSFKAYPKYKESGVEWLGRVPEDWEVAPLKAVASHNNDVLPEDTPADQEITYVDISGVEAGRGIIGSDTMTFSAAPSRARRRVRHGDVIVSTVRTYLRAIAPIADPEDNLIVSTGFAVIRPLERLSTGYAGYLLSAGYFIEQVIARSTGVSYPAINASDLVAIHTPVPPLDEQVAIANFLDHETAKIDALIAEQQRLIELLQEKRQAVISHAVTKGLNPDAPMKDSRIEWLGEVPEHWEVHKLGYSATLQGGFAFPADTFGAEGTAVVRMNNLKRGELDLGDAARIRESCCIEKVALHAGDLLWGMSGSIGATGSLGNYARVGENDLPCQLNQRVGRFVANPAVLDIDYLESLIQSPTFYDQVVLAVTGTAQFNISCEQVEACLIALPPRAEQSRIAAFLLEQDTKGRTLTAQSEYAISLLQERRSALISAAVTGQIDVRGFAGTEAA